MVLEVTSPRASQTAFWAKLLASPKATTPIEVSSLNAQGPAQVYKSFTFVIYFIQDYWLTLVFFF